MKTITFLKKKNKVGQPYYTYNPQQLKSRTIIKSI